MKILKETLASAPPLKQTRVLGAQIAQILRRSDFSERHALVVFPRGGFDPHRLHPAARLLRAWVQRGSRRRRGQRASVGKFSAKCCSFSAVSAPIFARKYAFCSIFQNLPDYQTEMFEIWQKFANFATFAKILLNVHKIADFSNRFFCYNFEIAAVQKYTNLVELDKCCQMHIFLQKFVLIQPRTSPPKICKVLLT